ncbi:MAG TPA: GNAT family N-acetyltransferase [Acidimicrobiales bacterium]|nr:GNAT family N-acetyltransferase [Acidimicrobiales bacterium]
MARDLLGGPAVIRNAPLLDDGTPMPTRFWLVEPSLRRGVDRLEAGGGVRRAEAAVDPVELAAAHRRYAAERDAVLPAGWTGPRPAGGVGGTRRGVKCLHAHLAWHLAGGHDPVGRWVDAELGGAALVRPARGDDLEALPDLEVAAGAAFRGLGMDAVAEDPPPTVDALAPYQEGGRAWVVTDGAGPPVAYLLAEQVDGCAHVEQVSVHPSRSGRRLGARLIGAAAAWGADRGLAAVTLTTFAAVPWNAPYYRRLGFRVLEPAEIGPGLTAILAAERQRGLAAWPRVAMRGDLAVVRRLGFGG